uniref:EvC ciliary complex subunit 2 n=1 Tax=Periophthalmus magnuspinnatus TaxID=409849 RepID=A0A3B3ZYI3_9GOBI
GPSHGSNLTQVAVRDSISGLAPVRSEVRSLGWSEGREVEAGYQSFAIDSLYAGSQVVLNYSAHIRSPKTGVLELPAYLTFSNASQNDVNMFGPLTANLTLRVNSTVRMFPHPTLHFAGFLGGFLVSLALVLLGFLFLNCVDPGTALRLCPKQRHGAASDLEFDTSEVSNGLKQEAEFEDKIVDIMTLEEPQDMQHALDSLETSSLLRASAQLEASRLQMHRDLVVALLSQGAGSGVTLVEVLLGQIMALEGRLQEEHQDKMAALTEHFNQEMRDTMNAINTQLLRDTEEREEAERKSRDTETALHCRTLQEKFHKLKERWVQHHLLVRQEEVSARVQREVAERRREVVHQIFCEELEEATRTGDMDQSSASTLQHLYFNCQDFLEQMWDEVVAHQKAILSERQTHRKLLVQSLQGVHSLVSETFCNNNSRRGGPGGELQALYDRGQQEVLVQRQRLQETVKQEKAALRCDLLQKRRDKLSNMVQHTCTHLHKLTHLTYCSRNVETKLDSVLKYSRVKDSFSLFSSLISFFCLYRRLLSSQLSLSDSDLLKLKLEYQKCFSVMDRCLVVPPAVLRAKVQRGLEEWRRSQEKLMVTLHIAGLAAAEEEFQQDLCRVDIDLAPPVDTDPLTTLSSVSPPPPIPPLLEDGVLEVKPDCNMGSILQEALYKREQLLSLSEESTSRTQIREDLRQHLELRRLQQLCAQDVKFTSVLVRLLEVPRDVLMQMLCVLLPALPERELLSLCESLSPKDLPQCPRLSSLNHLIVKLRADFTREASLDAPVCVTNDDIIFRMEEKRRGLLEKLLSSVCAPPPSATPLILVQPEIGTRSETGPEIGTRPGSDFLKLCLVKLFIFRDMPVSAQTPEGAIRKRRRNFLNLKKSSVAPLISDS